MQTTTSTDLVRGSHMDLNGNCNMGREKLFGSTYFEQDHNILIQESYFGMFRPMCGWFVYINECYRYTMSTVLSRMYFNCVNTILMPC